MLQFRAFGSACLLAAVSACATPTVPFEYAHPQPQLDASSGYVLVIERVRDARMGAQPIDKVLNQPPCDAVTTALEEEMQASGLFAAVVRTTDAGQAPLSSEKKAVRIDATLKDLNWNVAQYGNIQSMRTMSVVGFGLVGALARNAYESGNYVPVQGRAVMTVRLDDVATQTPLLEKTYMGATTESRPMSQCDTLQTQSHIVGAATADAIRQLKADLPGVLKTPVTPAPL